MGYITRLQAVNQMLLASGENLVADLENSSGVDTGIAETILDQISLDFQLRGLVNNKFIRKFTADSNTKYINLPTADLDEGRIISADLVSFHLNDDGVQIRSRVYEGSPPRLFNITDDTDRWEIGVDYYVELIKYIPWDQLDTASQRAIVSTAARQYQAVTQGDEATDAFLSYQEQLHNMRGRASNVYLKRKNILRNSDIYPISSSYRNMYLNDPNRFRYWRTRG
jgi:hypothetical protein